MIRWYLLSLSLVWTFALSGQPAKQREFLPPYNFQVDSVSLLATWEAPKTILLKEDFEGNTFPPSGWTKISLGEGWLGIDSPEYHWWWVVPEHPGKFAQVNDDIASFSNDGSMDFLCTPVMDLTVADSVKLFFDSYFDGAYGETAFLKYSIDGGATWQLLKQMYVSLEWQRQEVDLSSFSGQEGESSFQLAFHANDHTGNYDWASGWAVDNVVVYSNFNPHEVLGYKVFLDTHFTYMVDCTSFHYTSDYNSFHDCGVQARYSGGISDTVWQRVHSFFLYKPDSLSATVSENTAILTWDAPWIPCSKSGMPVSRDVGDIILSGPAPDPITRCWGICDDKNTLWITDPDLSSTYIYQVTYDFLSTGNIITISQGQSWIGDLVSDGQYLYGCLVGGPNSIVKVDLLTGETVGTISGDFSIAPQGGLTADFINEEFYIGGGNSNRIWRTDFNGTTISTHDCNNVSGLAWDYDGGPYGDGSLWVIVNSSNTDVSEILPAHGWTIIQTFQGPGGEPFSGAGIDIKKCEPDKGSLWMCNQVENMIYLVDLGQLYGTGITGLLGFNIYRNGEFLNYSEYIWSYPCIYNDPLDFSEQESYTYDVTAIYDVRACDFPADTAESLPDGPAEVTSCCWNELDFFEDWPLFSNGHLWKFSGENWYVDPEIGNEPPAAVFRADSILLQYKDTLQSYLFTTGTQSPVDVMLSFDVSLSSVNSTGNEKLLVQVDDAFSGSWNTVRIFDNAGGSFGWQRDTMNITNMFNDGGFRIRFTAQGENSGDINYWAVDNIALDREFYPPENITATILPPSEDSILVNWDQPVPDLGEWREWDDGVHSGSIGWGDGKESWHCMAAHWTPELLVELKGASLTAIGFIPSDLSACFKIAVWISDYPTPVYLQAAGNLVKDQWNIFPLNVPLKVDVTKDLYIGYEVSAYTGYPVSVDDGPAINGFGNLTKDIPDSTWMTLIQINPDLNYNWNIKAWFERDGYPVSGYKLFRRLDGSGQELIAEPDSAEFIDIADPGQTTFCYRVKSVFDEEFESKLSDEACVVITGSDPVQLDNDGSMSVFPNPSNQAIQIESSENIEFISIYNSFGEIMLKKKVDEKQLEILVASYPSGVYMIKVELGNRVISKKVMVVH